MTHWLKCQNCRIYSSSCFGENHKVIKETLMKIFNWLRKNNYIVAHFNQAFYFCLNKSYQTFSGNTLNTIFLHCKSLLYIYSV